MADDLVLLVPRSIEALRKPDASLARVPNTTRQSLADIIEALAAQLVAMTAERDARAREVTTMKDVIVLQKAQLTASEAVLGRAQAFLREHSPGHTLSCMVWGHEQCTCGLDAALASAPSERYQQKGSVINKEE